MFGICAVNVYIFVQLLLFCGADRHARSNLGNGRIVGGTLVGSISEIPYQISLRNDGKQCGGSIIHSSYVLTAAHCVQELKSLGTLSVKAGSNLRHEGVERKVCSVIIHEKYGHDYDFDYDIAILRLCQSLPLGPNVLPVALAESDEYLPAKTKGIVSGWGLTSENGSGLSRELRKITVAITNRSVCADNYKEVATITPQMLCATCANKGTCDACLGDSGGPLVAKGKLVGIVSFGYRCAVRRYPGVYANVANLRQWIRSKINL